MKKLSLTLSVVLVVTLIMLFVGEWILRLTADPMLKQHLDVSALMHWENDRGLVVEPYADRTIRLSSNEAVFRVRTDENGIRTNGHGASVQRFPIVLFLGDSMTFGFGVGDRQAYPSILQYKLDARAYNAGFRSGECLAPQSVYLRDVGLALEPDLVVLGFYTGNDLTDLRMYKMHGQDPFGLPERVTLPGGDFPPILKRTALYQYFGMRTIRRWLKNKPLSLEASTNTPNKNGKEFPYEPEWEIAERLLAGLSALCKSDKIELAVLVLPNKIPQDSVHREIASRVKTLGEKSGFAVLDLEPLLGANPNPSKYYFPIDGHLNEVGCRRVAEVATPFLRNILY